MVHSMRCNPSHAQGLAFSMFDGMVRRSLGDFTGIHLTAQQWLQASRGLAFGGLGLRSCEQHAPAAFLASVGACISGCQALDANFSVDEAKAWRRSSMPWSS